VNSVLYIPIEGDKSARRTVSSGIFIPGRSVRMWRTVSGWLFWVALVNMALIREDLNDVRG